MRFFKLIVEIRYPQNKPDIFSFREKIIAKVAVDKNLKLPNVNEGFEFRVKGKLMKVVIADNRFAIDMVVPNSIPNAMQYAQDNIIKVYKQVNSELRIEQIDRIGVRSIWHQEFDKPIEKLIQKFKANFFKENELVKESIDIALAFTLKENDRKINYNAGPMDINQFSQIINNNLKMYGSDKDEQVENPGVFMDYDYYLNTNHKYNDNFMVEFVKKGVNESEKKFIQTLKLLEINYV